MESIASIIIGVVVILMGISHRKGNISLLHSYHRNRVKEEDKIPYGKLLGLGMFIIGGTLMVVGGLTFAEASIAENIYSILRNVVLIGGLAAGCGVVFFAMFKYNKGIF